ncbi:MAG: HAD-IIA family hydrolase [Promethearchaeota archaeon]
MVSELKNKKVYFFDLDGTIYLGDQLFKGAKELVELLNELEIPFFFLSNNSSKSTSDYIKKLKDLGLIVTLNNLILSQHPTIDYLKRKNYKRIFLLGTESLKREFRQTGFVLSDNDPEVIVLAFDQELTYERLVKASYMLQEGLPYIATHLDDRCPTEKGYIPDAGGIAALLFKATERMPNVFGKPNAEMLLFKLREIEMKPEDAIIFGDRLYTDIKMGKEAGVTTCCVLSGETTLELIENNKTNMPDYIIDGIWEITEALIK